MNTTVWLITFTDSSGKQTQTVHAHNCVADFRVIDKNATAQEIDCAAVADLIEQMRDVMALWDSNEWSIDGKAVAVQCRPDKWRAALERVGGAK